MIAEHLEAAGDLHAAYGWHMRAGGLVDQPRHRRGADELGARPNDRRHIARRRPGPVAMRIAPRTMLCGDRLAGPANDAGARFDELRELCTAAGDKASLAVAMAGLVMDHCVRGRMRQASRLASEAIALIESLGDPTLTVGLSFAALSPSIECGEWPDVLRWSQRVIDLADGDPV